MISDWKKGTGIQGRYTVGITTTLHEPKFTDPIKQVKLGNSLFSGWLV